MRFNPERLLGIVLLLALTPLVSATTRYVNGVSGSDSNNCLSTTTACKTIGHAISLASSGDTIRVAAATYTENLSISESLNILGSGAMTTTIIDGGGTATVVTVSNTSAHVTLANLTIRNGQASRIVIIGFNTRVAVGGGINNSGILTLTNSTVSGNLAPIPCIRFFVFCEIRAGGARGGGIYNSGVLIITDSIISGNSAGSYCNANPCSASGGGIYNQGTLMTIGNSTLTANTAGTACSTSLSCSVGVGGALNTFGPTVTLNNSTVTGNYAYRCSGICSGTGAAIVNGSGNLAMNNSTVSRNSCHACGNDSVGGITNSGTVSINSSTIGGNTGIGVLGTAITLQNSILADNSGGNCKATLASKGYNLSSDATCNFSNTGDLNNTNPLLGPLQNNGGPTFTQALLSGSPAIDAGNPTGCTDGGGHLLKTDQRGQPRHDLEDTGGCDMGAYERQSD